MSFQVHPIPYTLVLKAGVIRLRSSTPTLLQMVNVQISPSRKETLS